MYISNKFLEDADGDVWGLLETIGVGHAVVTNDPQISGLYFTQVALKFTQASCSSAPCLLPSRT